jgi:hypothetical protein
VAGRPRRLLDDARNGQADIVTATGAPGLLTLPLGPAGGDSAERPSLAVSSVDRDLVSSGLTRLTPRMAAMIFSSAVRESMQKCLRPGDGGGH